ncbi:MAG: adenylosuccinate lyase family protein [Nisaea sp.]|uniref:class-II fumarase/aspartase family protein n=1 Tax=Nisaea sp. TaxID=2024842 RepID=UPI001B207ADA|nr:adenylosuccinate lyase family protein [Nisaea sp.]MBO6560389.1 adenylosuccinate lyase family protein [Nisaea sp.]
MSSIVVKSAIYGDMFGTADMRGLFADSTILGLYLDVETALARAQAKLGLIPEKAAQAITEAADVDRIDMERLSSRTQIVGYPILPLVEQLSNWAPDGLGQYCHWGATTQDIMDTADVLQVRAGLDIVEEFLERIATALAKLAEAHAETPMAGRTHLQHALPVSFGFKAATWLSAIDRHLQRLKELRPRVEVVQFSGAAGTLASLSGNGLATQAALAEELGLGVPDITWHTIRDGLAEVTGFLALVTGIIGKIGYDIMLMMQTETGEVLEPFVAGRGASSTMPQKRNPISSEMMLASSKIVREQHSAMLDAMVQDHERATGQWHVEWHALPTAFIVASGGLAAAAEVLEGLEVRPDAMRKVLDTTKGLIVAEAVMMGLAPHIGRQVAHDVVYDCCRKALAGEAMFLDALMEEKAISDTLDRGTVEALTKPENYLGEAPEMVRRLLLKRRG